MSGLDVRTFALGPIQTNAYIVRADAQAKRGLIIDPGEEAERLLSAQQTLDVEADAILITHCHFDHIGAVAPLAEATKAPVYCPAGERVMLADITSYTPPGFGSFEGYEPEHTLAGGEQLTLAGLRVEVLATPGHSPGHLTYAISPASGGEVALFSGDVLFQGSVGRVDLPGGDWSVLEHSIATLLERFPATMTFYPGHMGASTLGRERETNPFLQELREHAQPAGARPQAGGAHAS